MEYTINSHTLADFLDCREKARLRLAGWRRTVEPEWLTFGSLVHALIEKVLMAKPKQAERLRKSKNALEEAALEWMEAEGLYKARDHADLDMMQVEAANLVHFYFQYWESQKDWKKAQTTEAETYFEVDYKVPGLDAKVKLVGQRDQAVLWGKKGSRWIIEHKTRGQINPATILSAATISLQNKLYLLTDMLCRDVTQKPVGVVHDILRRPGLRLKQGETLDEYDARLEKDIEGRPEHYFIRIPVQYAKADVVEFQKELDAIITSFVRWREGVDPHFRNLSTNICAGRNTPCDYLDACSSGTDIGRVGLYYKGPEGLTHYKKQKPKARRKDNAGH